VTPAGLYFHIPFCVRKCRYCDFYSLAAAEGRQAAFRSAVMSEVARRRQPALAVDSIFFGGGTPSLLPPAFYARLLEDLTRHFDLDRDIEITLEANPCTVSASSLAAYRRAGINRLNLGIQSFDDRQLGFMGRSHTAAQALDAVALARRSGFDNLGLDLIYGLPGQTSDAWQAALAQAVALGPEHLACYALTYEPGTPLTRDRDAGGHRPAGDDQVATQFEITATHLTGAGYVHYEISNFAVDRCRRSRHNTKYWVRAPYCGFGPAAHTFQEPRRSWNVSNLDGYIGRLARGAMPEEGREELDGRQQMIETVFLGLRMAAGIDLAAFASRFGTALEAIAREAIAALTAEGCLAQRDGRLVPTLKGMRLHDSVSARLTGVL
jgi:oxygen-independent coproporphyrinogen-3 oxidase